MHGVRTSAPRASDSGRLHGASVPVPRIRDPGAQNRQVSLPGLREWTAKPEPECHLGPTMSPLKRRRRQATIRETRRSVAMTP
jgi:hypothetical protein